MCLLSWWDILNFNIVVLYVSLILMRHSELPHGWVICVYHLYETFLTSTWLSDMCLSFWWDISSFNMGELYAFLIFMRHFKLRHGWVLCVSLLCETFQTSSRLSYVRLLSLWDILNFVMIELCASLIFVRHFERCPGWVICVSHRDDVVPGLEPYYPLRSSFLSSPHWTSLRTYLCDLWPMRGPLYRASP